MVAGEETREIVIVFVIERPRASRTSRSILLGWPWGALVPAR
jgi:hypothetical protein